MIVERYTWRVGYGKREEFVESVKALVEALGYPPRVCWYVYGPMDIVTSDIEFETMQDNQKYQDNFDHVFVKSPAFAKFVEKNKALAVSFVTKELLNLN